MDYEQSWPSDTGAEPRIADVLRSEAVKLDFRVVNGLLLVEGQTTARLEHVLVDRCGIVIIETCRHGAAMRGSSASRSWTAAAAGQDRQRQRFPNPLKQIDRHREMLERLLGGGTAPLGFVQTLVVVEDGGLTQLALDDADAALVIEERDLPDFLHARCSDSEPKSGALDADRIANLVDRVCSADQSENPAAVALHAEHLERGTSRRRGRSTESATGPKTRTPAVPRIAKREPASGDRAERTPRLSSALEWLEAQKLALPAIALAVGLVLVVGGSVLVSNRSGGSSAGADSPPARSAGSVGVTYDVAAAVMRLAETSPFAYEKLAKAEGPMLIVKRGIPTYRWSYVDEATRYVAAPYRISVTLNPAGGW